ncbi:MAG: hypothetical protein WBG46_09275 [Nonlabens sp.]
MKKILLTLIISLTLISCKKENNYDNDAELCEIMSKMTTDDQRIRNMELLNNGSEKQKDSLWEIQNSIDKKNTELLIDITKKRGWVSKAELKCKKYMAPVVIFRHSPKEYWNEIREIIKTESDAGRMGSGDFMFIENNLEGRPDFDFKITE